MAFALAFRPVTEPDPDASKVLPVECTGCNIISVAADSDKPGARLTFRIAFRDSNGNPVGTTGSVTLVASQQPSWGPLFLAADATGMEPAFHCVGDLAYVQVTKLEPAVGVKWNLGADAR